MDQNKENMNSIYNVTNRILAPISSNLELSSSKATLARLRSSIGNARHNIDVWQIIFEHIPDSYLSTNGEYTREERAIITSIQIYALHQQGSKESVHDSNIKSTGNIGKSLRALRTEEMSKAVDRRFNAMITSVTYDELVYHLRHLINLLKSKSNSKVNYARLANDLFWFQMTNNEKIKLSWAQSYYSNSKEKEGN